MSDDDELMASTVQQSYDLPDGATLAISWQADRPATASELELLARLAQTVERSSVIKAGER